MSELEETRTAYADATAIRADKENAAELVAAALAQVRGQKERLIAQVAGGAEISIKQLKAADAAQRDAELLYSIAAAVADHARTVFDEAQLKLLHEELIDIETRYEHSIAEMCEADRLCNIALASVQIKLGALHDADGRRADIFRELQKNAEQVFALEHEKNEAMQNRIISRAHRSELPYSPKFTTYDYQNSHQEQQMAAKIIALDGAWGAERYVRQRFHAWKIPAIDAPYGENSCSASPREAVDDAAEASGVVSVS